MPRTTSVGEGERRGGNIVVVLFREEVVVVLRRWEALFRAAVVGNPVCIQPV